MAYCTLDDIIALGLARKTIIQLTDDGKLGEIDQTNVDAAIKRAGAEIDKHAEGRYTLPFSPVPDLVNGWAAELAAFYLYRGHTSIPHPIKDRRQGVMKNLSKLLDGSVFIPGAEDLLNSSAQADSTTIGQGHEFTRGEFDSAGKQITRGTTDIW